MKKNLLLLSLILIAYENCFSAEADPSLNESPSLNTSQLPFNNSLFKRRSLRGITLPPLSLSNLIEKPQTMPAAAEAHPLPNQVNPSKSAQPISGNSVEQRLSDRIRKKVKQLEEKVWFLNQLLKEIKDAKRDDLIEGNPILNVFKTINSEELSKSSEKELQDKMLYIHLLQQNLLKLHDQALIEGKEKTQRVTFSETIDKHSLEPFSTKAMWEMHGAKRSLTSTNYLLSPNGIPIQKKLWQSMYPEEEITCFYQENPDVAASEMADMLKLSATPLTDEDRAVLQEMKQEVRFKPQEFRFF